MTRDRHAAHYDHRPQLTHPLWARAINWVITRLGGAGIIICALHYVATHPGPQGPGVAQTADAGTIVELMAGLFVILFVGLLVGARRG